MSNLRINTRCGQQINPEFVKLFLAIAEDNADAPINITSVNPLLLNKLATEESHTENEDIQNMALFLLVSGAVLGVKWGEFYYFGDVDRMDNEPCFDEDMDNVTLIQYEIED